MSILLLLYGIQTPEADTPAPAPAPTPEVVPQTIGGLASPIRRREIALVNWFIEAEDEEIIISIA